MNLDLWQIRGRLDAGFTDGVTLRAMDPRDIAYLGRLKSNSVLQPQSASHREAPMRRWDA